MHNYHTKTKKSMLFLVTPLTGWKKANLFHLVCICHFICCVTPINYNPAKRKNKETNNYSYSRNEDYSSSQNDGHPPPFSPPDIQAARCIKVVFAKRLSPVGIPAIVRYRSIKLRRYTHYRPKRVNYILLQWFHIIIISMHLLYNQW